MINTWEKVEQLQQKYKDIGFNSFSGMNNADIQK